MSQKKKLILGPLPEEIDFSRYEETVTRWDRVIGAIALVIIVLGVMVYLLWPEQDKRVEANEAIEAHTVSVEASSPELSAADAAPVPQEVMLTPNSVESASEDKLELPVSSQADQAVQQQTEEAKPVDAEADAPLKALAGQPVSLKQPEQSDAPVSQQIPPVQTLDSQPLPVDVRIHHPGITRAVITKDPLEQQESSELRATFSLPEGGLTKVILDTDMKGLRGLTLYHDWYRNGQRQARVTVPVSRSPQQARSSKFINAQMLGRWQVKVVDDKNKLYIDAEFNVLDSE